MCFAHVAGGVALTKKAKNPLVIFVSCVGLHLLFDAVPHWNPCLAQPQLICLDLALAAVVLHFMRGDFWQVALATLGSIFPDLLFIFEQNFLHNLSWFSHFHGRIQPPNIDPVLGFTYQVMLVCLLLRATQIREKTPKLELSCEQV